MTHSDSPAHQPSDSTWEFHAPEGQARVGEHLIVDVEGFEGPLDLLLAMARTQKVDLARISVLALAEQYLAFVEQARKVRLELAADYLVMAAWLTFLKSRLLLPKEQEDEDQFTGEELAQRLAFRLARLDAMRSAAAELMARKRLGRDVFGRGMPEPVRRFRDTQYTAELFDLLKAYANQRVRALPREHVIKKRTVWSIKRAREQLEKLIGEQAGSWVQLDLFLDHYGPSPEATRTVVASSFGAALEMAREGLVEVRQERAFGPIHVRLCEGVSKWQAE